MVVTLTNAQNNSFFENGPQMGLTAVQRTRLAGEGLAQVADFEEFKEGQLEVAIRNLRTPIPGVPAVVDADGNEVHPAIPPVPPCIISARCALRLKVASIAYHYYENIGRNITAQNMNYTTVLKDFYQEYEAIITLSKEDRPDVPQLSKHQTPIKWMESFKDCLYRTFGVRMCPITYVIRPEANVPPEDDDPLDLANNKAFSARSGSVLKELIRQLSHFHPLYRSDNNLVYSLLDEATRGTIYAPTIKPYSRTKNGREAWEAIVSSHAGSDKWELIQKDRLRFLMSTKWNGKTYSLEKFTGLHRCAFVA